MKVQSLQELEPSNGSGSQSLGLELLLVFKTLLIASVNVLKYYLSCINPISTSTPFHCCPSSLLTHGLFSLLSIFECQGSLLFHTLLQSSLSKTEVSDLPLNSSYSITHQSIHLVILCLGSYTYIAKSLLFRRLNNSLSSFYRLWAPVLTKKV